MKNWHKYFPPYEGEEPYLYVAFAAADEKKVWKILRPLLERGCRVWYRFGPAGGADNLLHDATDGAGEEDFRALFVSHHGRTGFYCIAFFDQQPGNQAVDVCRLDSNNVRAHGFDDFGLGGSLNGNVQTLFQSEIV